MLVLKGTLEGAETPGANPRACDFLGLLLKSELIIDTSGCSPGFVANIVNVAF